MKFGKMTKGKLVISIASVVLALMIPLICNMLGSGAYLLNVIDYVFVYIIAIHRKAMHNKMPHPDSLHP